MKLASTESKGCKREKVRERREREKPEACLIKIKEQSSVIYKNNPFYHTHTHKKTQGTEPRGIEHHKRKLKLTISTNSSSQ